MTYDQLEKSFKLMQELRHASYIFNALHKDKSDKYSEVTTSGSKLLVANELMRKITLAHILVIKEKLSALGITDIPKDVL